MSQNLASTFTSMEAALMASHILMTSPTARPQTPPPSTTSLPETPKPTMHRVLTPRTPKKPLQQLLPTTPSAPRKRSPFKSDPGLGLTTPPRRTRTTISSPHSTPTKSRRSRKKVIPLDQAICIPMHVLRVQKEDTSALLRSPPKPSDRLRKLVDGSIGKTLEKLRSPGATGVLDAAVRSPRVRVADKLDVRTKSPTKRAREE
ncbi:hypothetical protein OPT61_g7416 [Boeremia exigua]|uniref:Uncharacterized protein n=1 Tax=Boeremia exigua TaxID=749465 RepID=A0ACC2I2K1_9PLEO|nr:hypothetical protein OPT61_g7416 [Boeremia exigua]